MDMTNQQIVDVLAADINLMIDEGWQSINEVVFLYLENGHILFEQKQRYPMTALPMSINYMSAQEKVMIGRTGR